MKITRENKNIWLFIGFIVLAGIVYRISWSGIPYVAITMFCINFLIYAGLILMWTQSIRDRLLPTRFRSYITAAAFFMLSYLIVRAFKYRVMFNDPPLARYCVYLYYVPMVMIPALFLMVCLRINRSESSGRFDERMILAPALVLSALFLTNDLHQLIYRPKVDLAEFMVDSGTYSYGPVFYITYAWMIITVFVGIALLFRVTHRFNWKRVLPFLAVLAVWVGMIAIINITERIGQVPLPYKASEVHIFCMLGLYEACIRNRLIPYNENYQGFFRQLKVPVLITDPDLNPVYTTALEIKTSENVLLDSLEAPIRTDKDTRISGMEIKGGFAFFAEDESSLNRMNESLREANDLLSLENELIEREQELAKEKAAIDQRSGLYAEVAHEVYPTQKLISELLASAEPGSPDLRDKVAEILLLTTFVKRKANFILLTSERDYITAEELSSAMKESVFYLKYLGISAAFSSSASEDRPCQAAIDVYECFKHIIGLLVRKTTEIWVRLTDDELIAMAEQSPEVDLSSLAFPVEQSLEDGQLILRVKTGGEIS